MSSKVEGMKLIKETYFAKDYVFSLWQKLDDESIGCVLGYDYDYNGLDSYAMFQTPEMPFWQAKNLYQTIEFGYDVYYGRKQTHNEITPELWK